MYFFACRERNSILSIIHVKVQQSAEYYHSPHFNFSYHDKKIGYAHFVFTVIHFTHFLPGVGEYTSLERKCLKWQHVNTNNQYAPTDTSKFVSARMAITPGLDFSKTNEYILRIGYIMPEGWISIIDLWIRLSSIHISYRGKSAMLFYFRHTIKKFFPDQINLKLVIHLCK